MAWFVNYIYGGRIYLWKASMVERMHGETNSRESAFTARWRQWNPIAARRWGTQARCCTAAVRDRNESLHSGKDFATEAFERAPRQRRIESGKLHRHIQLGHRNGIDNLAQTAEHEIRRTQDAGAP